MHTLILWHYTILYLVWVKIYMPKPKSNHFFQFCEILMYELLKVFENWKDESIWQPKINDNVLWSFNIPNYSIITKPSWKSWINILLKQNNKTSCIFYESPSTFCNRSVLHVNNLPKKKIWLYFLQDLPKRTTYVLRNSSITNLTRRGG